MSYIFKKCIDGVLYRAQFKGMAFAKELVDMCEDNKVSHLDISNVLFGEILVSPKIDIDDFDDIGAYTRVFNFLYNVAIGRFTEKHPSKAKLRMEVEEEWALWRLVLSESGFDFPTVFGKPFMTPRDIEKANIALDIKIDAEKKAAKRKR